MKPVLILDPAEHRHIIAADPLALSFDLNEIFFSVQGEGTRVGMPCIFIRLHGCKLRCSYCDTKYAIDRRQNSLSITGADIDKRVQEYGCNFVEFTGGEPLEQPNVYGLMKYYCDKGFTVAVETGGHVDTEPCDERVIRIIDMKTPSSKMLPKNNYHNLEILRPHDEVKFVIGSREDYEWSKKITLEYNIANKAATVLFSPVFGTIEYKHIVEWILEDRLNVRFQLQMHKFIWHPDMRGV